jgi:hypothetical protein
MLTLLVLLRGVVSLTRQSSLATNDAERCTRHRLCARAVAPLHLRGKRHSAKGLAHILLAKARSAGHSVAQHTTAALLLDERGAREIGTLKNLAQTHIRLEICSNLL